MDILIILDLVITPQYIRMSNHPIVHFKYIKLHLSIILNKVGGKNTKEASAEKTEFYKCAFFTEESPHYRTNALKFLCAL